MWSGGDEINDGGEAIQLYVPAKGPARKTNTSPADSHIGGSAHQRDAPTCRLCQDTMKLMVQLNLTKSVNVDGSKVNRMIYVFCCSRPSCFEQMKFEEGFASSSGGIMVSEVHEVAADLVPQKIAVVAPKKSSWYDDGESEEDDDDDWGVAGDGGTDMASLEQAMAEMEKKVEQGATPNQARKSEPKLPQDVQAKEESAFPCFLLTKQMEPPALNPVYEDDDVGLSTDDEKIRNMLARYMAEEDDENILAALKGTDGGGNIGEEDERLPEESRLFRGFQDRLQRAPRQVVRYARGGEPLWSIPSVRNNRSLWETPVCRACETKCSFEMQLLPSLLHVLQVDKFSQQVEGMKVGDLLKGGINWGSVAVFTCPNSNCNCSECEVVIQAGVDEDPGVDEVGEDRNFEPTVAVVEDMEDDCEFEQYEN